MVSRRAARLVAGSPAIAVAHFRAEAEPYDPEHRPDGYLNVGTAENLLVWDLLEPLLTAPRGVTLADTRYAPLYGTPALREAIAHHLARWWRADVDADDLVVVAGATAALDVVASTLCDPGDAIVVPAPYYGAFDVDLAGRSGARLVPAPLDGDEGFALAPEAIDRALGRARRDGATVRAVALTSPSNPVGEVHDARVLGAVSDVAAGHGVDLVSDEVYANCAFGAEPFVSVRHPSVASGWDGRTHVVWGFAKDFGLPGIKAGVLHARDPEVRAAARELAYFAPLSTDTQHLLARLLADDAWVDRFLAENRRRLAASYRHATEALAAQGIPFLPAAAGFSVWCDLRRWLPSPTPAGEHALWQGILDRARVNVLPGGAFACPEPGWFRLCHTQAADRVAEAIARVGNALRGAAVGAPPQRATAPPAGPGPAVRPAPGGGAFDRWYEVAGVRSGTRRWFRDESDEGKVFFPEALVPHLGHEAVRSLAPDKRAEMACRHLHHFLLSTTHMETRVVNRAAERIANGRAGVDVPAALRLDAFKVYTDEGYHALYSLDLADQVVAATGIAAPAVGPERFLQRLDATRRRLLPDEPELAQLVQVVVFETLITAVLHEVPKDERVMSPVRAVLRDHARDEGRHHRFFSAFFRELWAHLDAGARGRVARAMPPLILGCLATDTEPVLASLRLAGVGEDVARAVADDCYGDTGEAARRRAREVAGATLRLCEAVGVTDAPGARDAFAAHGLSPAT